MEKSAAGSQSGLLVLIASSLLAALFGSVHAFSVFLEPLESQFGASRSAVSLTYSLALVFLTLAVLMGHRLFSLVSCSRFVMITGSLAVVGIIIAVFSPSLALIWLGYGVIFGAANGLGYGYGLQLSAQANPASPGFAMGVVTASYGLGATVSPPIFAAAVENGGFRSAMLWLTLALLLLVPVSALLLARSGARFQTEQRGAGEALTQRGEVVKLWIAYGAAVAAGLMSLGHATGILKSAGWLGALWIAPVVISLCGVAGSLIGGWLVDRWSQKWLLAGLTLLSGGALLTMSQIDNGFVGMAGLGFVGLSYGALIACYPAVILKRFGAENSTFIYGRVFTAWGLAGLLAPVLAGTLYDRQGDYEMALLVAAAFSLLSIAIIWQLQNQAGSGAHNQK